MQKTNDLHQSADTKRMRVLEDYSSAAMKIKS